MGASGLGSLLVKEGFLTEQDRLTITKTCGQGSWAFAKSILAIGLLDEDELAAFFAERTRFQIAPKDFLLRLDQSAIQSVDKRLVTKLEIIPLKRDPGRIMAGVVDPLDRSILKQLEFFTGLEVTPVVVPLSQLYEGLSRIDPHFREQPTALTHFLTNHAQGAWSRQTVGSGQAPAKRKQPPQSRRPSSELYEDLRHREDLDDDSHQAELEAEMREEDNHYASRPVAEADPFAGTGSIERPQVSADELDMADSFDAELDGMSSDEMDLEDEPEASEDVAKSSSSASSFDDILEIVTEDNADEFDFNSSSSEPKDSKDAAAPMKFDQDQDEGEPETSGNSATPSDADRVSFDGPEDEADESELFDFGDGEPEVDPLAKAEDNFAFEETKPRAMPAGGRDVLDTLNDGEPSLDLSALPEAPMDDDVFADLHADSEDMPSVDDGDEFRVTTPARTAGSPAPKPDATESLAFGEEEETHIDLHPATAVDEDDDDILLHPKPPAERRDSGLNPTSHLNETVLKLSLSFHAEGVRQVLESSLTQIGGAGFMWNKTSKRQVVWIEGHLLMEDVPAAVLGGMLKASEDKAWKFIDVKAQDSWSQKALRLRVYRDGDWLWGHSLNHRDDTGIFRETVEGLIRQVADKEGAGQYP